MTLTVRHTGEAQKCRLCPATVAILANGRLRDTRGTVFTDRGTFYCKAGHPNDLSLVDDEVMPVGERL